MGVDVRGSSGRMICAAILAGILTAAPAMADGEDGSPQPPARDVVERVGENLAGWLERDWPGHPEWLAMFSDILRGSQLGPRDGWFRMAVAHTRHGWDDARKRLDRDGDGRIARAEFPGNDEDYGRLDRDGDGSLGPADFDWSAHALAFSRRDALLHGRRRRRRQGHASGVRHALRPAPIPTAAGSSRRTTSAPCSSPRPPRLRPMMPRRRTPARAG